MILSTILTLTVLGLLLYAGHRFGRYMKNAEDNDRYWREIRQKDEHKLRISGKLRANGKDLMIKIVLLTLLSAPAFGQSFHAKKYRREAAKTVMCPHFKAVYYQPIKAKKESPGFVMKRKKLVKMRMIWK